MYTYIYKSRYVYIFCNYSPLGYRQVAVCDSVSICLNSYGRMQSIYHKSAIYIEGTDVNKHIENNPDFTALLTVMWILQDEQGDLLKAVKFGQSLIKNPKMEFSCLLTVRPVFNDS